MPHPHTTNEGGRSSVLCHAIDLVLQEVSSQLAVEDGASACGIEAVQTLVEDLRLLVLPQLPSDPNGSGMIGMRQLLQGAVWLASHRDRESVDVAGATDQQLVRFGARRIRLAVTLMLRSVTIRHPESQVQLDFSVHRDGPSRVVATVTVAPRDPRSGDVYGSEEIEALSLIARNRVKETDVRGLTMDFPFELAEVEEEQKSWTSRLVVALSDKSIRLAVVGLLQKEGVTCDTSPDADHLRERLRLKHYDAVVLEYALCGQSSNGLIADIQRNATLLIVLGGPGMDAATSTIANPPGTAVELAEVIRLELPALFPPRNGSFRLVDQTQLDASLALLGDAEQGATPLEEMAESLGSEARRHFSELREQVRDNQVDTQALRALLVKIEYRCAMLGLSHARELVDRMTDKLAAVRCRGVHAIEVIEEVESALLASLAMVQDILRRRRGDDRAQRSLA